MENNSFLESTGEFLEGLWDSTTLLLEDAGEIDRVAARLLPLKERP